MTYGLARKNHPEETRCVEQTTYAEHGNHQDEKNMLNMSKRGPRTRTPEGQKRPSRRGHPAMRAKHEFSPDWGFLHFHFDREALGGKEGGAGAAHAECRTSHFLQGIIALRRQIRPFLILKGKTTRNGGAEGFYTVNNRTGPTKSAPPLAHSEQNVYWSFFHVFSYIKNTVCALLFLMSSEQFNTSCSVPSKGFKLCECWRLTPVAGGRAFGAAAHSLR